MRLSRSHDPSHGFNGLIWVDVVHFLFFKIDFLKFYHSTLG